MSSLKKFKEETERLETMLNGVLLNLEEFKETPLYEKLSVHVAELKAVHQRLNQSSTFLSEFSSEKTEEKRVRWFEESKSNATIVNAALDISAFLSEHLFSKQRTAVLCSATIATAKSFSFIKQRLGLVDFASRTKEGIFESPFNYEERTLFAVPTDLVAPSHPNFLSECIHAMQEIIEISKGSVFLLFTSYDMLQNCYRSLSNTPLAEKYPFLKQGDLPRHLLLEQFKKKVGSVLFATDSFWEGVDVPGEALRCVVIAKLPFSVPSDPLYEAYSQSLEKEGLDPFMDYSVPQAVIKFKQGFGRLMRKSNDRGCVVCLDHRIAKKNYGRQFLKSLPPCKTVLAPKAEVFAEMKKLYAKTAVF